MRTNDQLKKIYVEFLPAFPETYVKFPKCNDICSSDHEEAVLYILDRISEKYDLHEEDQSTLNDHISGGLA